MDLEQLAEPIVQAPLAGGPSTPALSAAVIEAGGLGFLAAGYRTAEAVAGEIRELRELSDGPFGVNVFAPPADRAEQALVDAYAQRLAAEASRYGVALGEPRFDDDRFAAKLEVLIAERVPIVSFTFGCPPVDVLERLHEGGADVWVTVTSPEEARQAAAAGADVLVAQGLEAGGHRGSFDDERGREDFGLLALLQLLRAQESLPLVASGGIGNGAAVAAVLCAGALAAQMGSAFLRTPEAGTSDAHRSALASPRSTALTRAFSGRRARGIVNRFMTDHDDASISAYPQVHHLTAPIRAAARERGDGEAINLWAGQAHALAGDAPAGELVRELGAEARQALAAVTRRLA